MEKGLFLSSSFEKKKRMKLKKKSFKGNGGTFGQLMHSIHFVETEASVPK